MIAGRADEVASSLAALQIVAPAAGLVVEPTKCELVAVAGNRSADFSLFLAGFAVKGAAFDLLGAPIGDSEYYTQATLSDKVQKAGKVLDALGELDNPRVSLQLLRHCACFTKLVHNMRTTPAGLHSAALVAFDGKVRACLESIGCFPVPDRTWHQATLGVKHGGLGLRQCAVHATAAYLASVATTQDASRFRWAA